MTSFISRVAQTSPFDVCDSGTSAYGNMSCQINGQTNGYCASFSFNPSTNQINLAGVSYDAAGNFMTDGTHTYQWDAEGRLAGVDGADIAL